MYSESFAVKKSGQGFDTNNFFYAFFKRFYLRLLNTCI